MNKSENQIFRKVSLDRLSSPEQLDQLAALAPGKHWLSIFALVVFAAIFAAWACFGAIPRQVSGNGALYLDVGGTDDGRPYALVYMNSEDGAQIKTGMQATIYPEADTKISLRGSVADVSKNPAGSAKTGDYEVRVTLADTSAGDLAAVNDPALTGQSGQECEVEITTGKFSPIKLLLQ